MSWLSSAIKGVGHTVGRIASNPLVDAGLAGVLALTGVGAPAAAAILGGTKAAGNLLSPGGNIGDAARGAVTGGAEGALAGGIGHLLGAGGGAAGTAAGDVAGDVATDAATTAAATGGIPGVQSVTDIVKNVPGGVESVGKYAANALGLNKQNILQKGLGWLTGNSGANALGLAQALNSIYLQKKSSDAANRAIQGLESSYAERAPLRTAGLQGMLNPITPDLSSLLVNAGPYAQGLPAIVPAARYTGVGTATAPGRVS